MISSAPTRRLPTRGEYVGFDEVLQALQIERSRRKALREIAERRQCRCVDDDFAGQRLPLQPRGEVDVVADDGELPPLTRAENSDCHCSRGDADSGAERLGSA